MRGESMADLVPLSYFALHVGRSFRLRDAGGTALVLSLAQPLPPVTKAGGAVLPGRREPFELMFTGPLTPILNQQIYWFEADGLDPIEIFIVPIGPYEGGMGYQAVFN